MSFTTSIKTCFRRYVSFSGRARRSEFWWFYLFTALISAAFFVVLLTISLGSGIASGNSDAASLGGGVLYGLVSLASLVVSLALLLPTLGVMWRRLHDTDRSGLWWFIGLIPLIGGIVLIVFWAQDSTSGTNRFGPSPKAAAAPGDPTATGYGAQQPGYGYSV